MKLILGQLSGLLRANVWLVFLGLVLLSGLTLYLDTTYVRTEAMLMDTLGKGLLGEEVDAMLASRKVLLAINYISIPIQLLFKVGVVAVCLNIGMLLLMYRPRFADIFKVAMMGELVIILAGLFRIIWLMSFAEGGNAFNISIFYPMALINFVPPANIEPWMIFPLRMGNVFQLVYILTLGLGLHWQYQKTFKKMLGIAAGSYGFGLLALVILIVFLQLNIT